MQPTLPPAPADEDLLSVLESLLLVAGGPVSIAALASAAGVDRAAIQEAVSSLQRKLQRGIRLQQHGDQVQLVTAPDNAEYVHRFLGSARPPSLSRATLETLTVIAYRQPVTRAEIEAVRGVNSDRAVQTLLARNLIEERGQRETLGRPMQYGTGFGFLEYFGLASLAELPPLPEEAPEAVDPGRLGMRTSSSEREA